MKVLLILPVSCLQAWLVRLNFPVVLYSCLGLRDLTDWQWNRERKIGLKNAELYTMKRRVLLISSCHWLLMGKVTKYITKKKRQLIILLKAGNRQYYWNVLLTLQLVVSHFSAPVSLCQLSFRLQNDERQKCIYVSILSTCLQKEVGQDNWSPAPCFLTMTYVNL